MQLLNSNEIALIAGADAAATRLPGTNSWGESTGADYGLTDCLRDNQAFGGGGVFGVLYCMWNY